MRASILLKSVIERGRRPVQNLDAERANTGSERNDDKDYDGLHTPSAQIAEDFGEERFHYLASSM